MLTVKDVQNSLKNLTPSDKIVLESDQVFSKRDVYKAIKELKRDEYIDKKVKFTDEQAERILARASDAFDREKEVNEFEREIFTLEEAIHYILNNDYL